MRFRTVLAVLVAFGVVGVAGAGAGTAAVPAAQLSSTHAIAAYLAARGIDMSNAVVQHGRKNYAGPVCPGRGWTCTRSTRVIQIAMPSGENVVECTDASCTISQSSSSNKAHCAQKSSDPGAVQSCTITQAGDRNWASVDQSVKQKDSSTQSATQTANVTQTATKKNELHINQDADQSTKTGATQTQDVHQTATADQTATGSGDNQSDVHQSQEQKASDATVSQSQNLILGSDCDSLNSFSPDNPNACANISQHSGAGKNDSHLNQSIDEDMKSGAAATQSQQAFTGGIDGAVHQDTASGTSKNEAHQSKTQRAKGGSTQTQYDPMSCCGFFSQDGGTGNKEDIHQSSTQDASLGTSAFQQSTLWGTSNSPDGTCSIDQHAKNNTDGTNNSPPKFDPCTPVLVMTECTSDGGCTPSPPVACTTDGESVYCPSD